MCVCVVFPRACVIERLELHILPQRRFCKWRLAKATTTCKIDTHLSFPPLSRVYVSNCDCVLMIIVVWKKTFLSFLLSISADSKTKNRHYIPPRKYVIWTDNVSGQLIFSKKPTNMFTKNTYMKWSPWSWKVTQYFFFYLARFVRLSNLLPLFLSFFYWNLSLSTRRQKQAKTKIRKIEINTREYVAL